LRWPQAGKLRTEWSTPPDENPHNLWVVANILRSGQHCWVSLMAASFHLGSLGFTCIHACRDSGW